MCKTIDQKPWSLYTENIFLTSRKTPAILQQSDTGLSRILPLCDGTPKVSVSSTVRFQRANQKLLSVLSFYSPGIQ
jgi:hypothetical protein